jgi:tripartite-type tricarboxylate transporter receptor subunit TctC
MKLNTYFVLLAPAGTPKPILDVLEREVRKATASTDLQKRWRAATLDPLGSSAAEAKARLKEETALWADIVPRAKLKR